MDAHRLPETVSSRLLPNGWARVGATLPEGVMDARRIEESVDGAFSGPHAEAPLGVTIGRELQRGARVHGLLPRLASITLAQAARG